jgi:hypothetical protein
MKRESIEQCPHLAEIAAILAAGFLRVSQRKSSPNSTVNVDSPLDCGALSDGDMAGNLEVSEP